jgi:hypothetical protein
MERNDLTQKIRERMAAGTLPRVIPNLTAPGRPTSPTGHITADTGIGVVTCAACDERGAQVALSFPDGRIVRFHGRCHRIWEDECRRVSMGIPAPARPGAADDPEGRLAAGR